MRTDPLLSIADLHTYFETDAGTVKAVDGVSFDVYPGETVALVGESGSGKTVTSESITRLFMQPPGYIHEGSIEFDGTELTDLTERQLRAFRGGRIGHVFQNPQDSLTPVYTVGRQVRDALEHHHDVTADEATERALDLLAQVGLPNPRATAREYPTALSGGMKQRVLIAIALACEPDLLIADEPTTALDVTTQAQILRLLADLQAERDMALLFVTHDLGVVAGVAEYVVVMYAGTVMEKGPVEDIFDAPAHPYTRALFDCVPGSGHANGIPGTLPDPVSPPAGCRFADRCSHVVDACTQGGHPPLHPVTDDGDHLASCVLFEDGRDPENRISSTYDGNPSDDTSAQRPTQTGEPVLQVVNLTKHYPITRGLRQKEVGRVSAVDSVSFELGENETLGIVGESGCGKSTLASMLVQLEAPTEGQINFRGEDVTTYDAAARKRFRRTVQMVFQDPDSSFDPRLTVGEAVAEPLVVHGMEDEHRRARIVEDLFERVGLSPEDTDRYPHEFSGGQKQRLALARALSVNPEIVIADEPVSALDVSVQAEILSLIEALKNEFGLSFVVISHDLNVVRQICDRVAVMYLGEFVEVGPTDTVLSNPLHPYTKALLDSILEPDPSASGGGVELTGDVPDASSPPSGCRFHTRCPSVIPPEKLDVRQETWRNVLALRKRVLASDGDREQVVDLAQIESGPGQSLPGTSLDSVPSAVVRESIRTQYGIPESVRDSAAEQTLETAISAIVEGRMDEAAAHLNGLFVTPCEVFEPTTQEYEPGHEAACLLHESPATSLDVLRAELEDG